MTINPRFGLYLSLLGVIIGVFAVMPAASLTTLFGPHGAEIAAVLLPAIMTIISGVNGILHMIPAPAADNSKFMLGPTAPTVPPAVKTAIVLGILLGTLVLPSMAFAQQRPRDALGVPGGLIHKPSEATESQSQADPLAQLASKFNADLTADLTSALALASQTDAKGNAADQTAIPCYTALINLNKTINGLNVQAPAAGDSMPSATPPASGPTLITHFEKLRILKNALTNQAFRDACAPLVQDVQQSANQLLGQVFAIIGGAAKLGIALP